MMERHTADVWPFWNFIKDLGGDQRGKCQLRGVSLFPGHGWSQEGPLLLYPCDPGSKFGEWLSEEKKS